MGAIVRDTSHIKFPYIDIHCWKQIFCTLKYTIRYKDLMSVLLPYTELVGSGIWELIPNEHRPLN